MEEEEHIDAQPEVIKPRDEVEAKENVVNDEEGTEEVIEHHRSGIMREEDTLTEVELVDISDDSEDEDNEEANVHYSAFMQQKKMPPEFWIVQKLIRYLSSHLNTR